MQNIVSELSEASGAHTPENTTEGDILQQALKNIGLPQPRSQMQGNKGNIASCL